MKKVTILMALILFCSWQFVLAQKTITGKVTDANDGSTLPGVNVVVKGTTTGTVTDMNGGYTLKAPTSALTLVFSFVGYENLEVAINGQSTIDVILKPSAEQLKEVVVTALGIRRDQKALGYAVAQVSSKELTKVGSTNFGSALYGKAAGVRIQTAPGGATSAVTINIRGINSLTGPSQPLIVVDGIPFRNGEVNNNGYWDDQRIRGNGLIDLNPEDIESVTILKGAAAGALYGSESGNGVVMITTKSGKGFKKGLGVDANVTYTVENAAFLPKFQNTYGPGYDKGTNVSVGATDEGWFMVDLNGDGTNETYRPYFRAYGQFGPKFDGREVIGWDGEMHAYNAQPDNYKNLYRTGSNQVYNIALTQGSDKSNFRLSYTRSDYKGVQKGGNHNRNSFSLNGTVKINPKNTTDVIFNYINQYTHNRPEMISRITNNYGGFFSRFDDMQWYYDNYKTSKGYKYVYGANTPSITPDENLVYNMRAFDLMEYLWRNNQNTYDEYNNRIVGSVTNTYEIMSGLKLRGRFGTDYTSLLEQTKNKNEVPLSLGNSGYFGQGTTLYNTLYGDVLLMLDKKITNNIGIFANAGFSGRKDEPHWNSMSTNGGLSVENWFAQQASVNTPTANSGRSASITQAILGTVGVNFKDYLFLEANLRNEKFSELPPKHNFTTYPSFNLGFVYSEAFKMPEFMTYGKVRFSYGVVGIPPPRYAANVAYNQSSLSGIIYNSLPKNYGNDAIKPEEKHEWEIGLETKYFNNRLGIDLTYYDDKIVGQILNLTVPATTGFTSMLANVGTLSNKGFEAVIYGTPVQTTNFRWDVRFNLGINKNKIVKLMEGLDVLQHGSYDADAVRLLSKVGEAMGDFYTYVPLQIDGKDVIDENGYYKIDWTEMKKVGNVSPKAVGGFANTLTYRDFFVDFVIDYRFGGDILSLGNHYMMGAGMFEETMQYRDADNGGVAYYVDGDGKNVATTAAAGPAGEKVYHDGAILPGVQADGTPNDVIIDAANYYLVTYTWGLNAGWAPNTRYDKSIQKNSYIKFRELSVGYNLPKSAVSRIGFQNLSVSFIGSNLFYLYKTLKNADPEVALGTNWTSQAIDAGSSAATRTLGIQIRAGF